MLVDKESHVGGKTEARKLKLSEAIRIGAALRPQAIGTFYAQGGSCVLGAAYEALGHKMGWCVFQHEVYPALKNYFDVSDGFLIRLADMNNGGKSREAIADFVESLGK